MRRSPAYTKQRISVEKKTKDEAGGDRLKTWTTALISLASQRILGSSLPSPGHDMLHGTQNGLVFNVRSTQVESQASTDIAHVSITPQQPSGPADFMRIAKGKMRQLDGILVGVLTPAVSHSEPVRRWSWI